MTNKLIEKMAEAIYALQPETNTKDRSVGTNMDNDFVTIPYADACNKDNALAKAQAAHACIPEITANGLTNIIWETYLASAEPLPWYKINDAIKALAETYPNGFWVDD